VALARLRALLPALWAGVVLAVGLLAAPAAFGTLAPADAGRLVGRVFAHEAFLSLAAAVFFVMLDRRVGTRAMGADTLLALGALFCTVAGYFALQPMMADARAGVGPLNFAALHAISLAFFGLKMLLLLALAWRCAGVNRPAQSS
jgi:hypothetical protein